MSTSSLLQRLESEIELSEVFLEEGKRLRNFKTNKLLIKEKPSYNDLLGLFKGFSSGFIIEH